MFIRIRDTSAFQHIFDFGAGTDLLRMPSSGAAVDVYNILLPGGVRIAIDQKTYDELANMLEERGILDFDVVRQREIIEKERAAEEEANRLAQERQEILDAAERVKATEEEEAETQRLAELGRAAEKKVTNKK